jgi:hypothetical protein
LDHTSTHSGGEANGVPTDMTVDIVFEMFIAKLGLLTIYQVAHSASTYG